MPGNGLLAILERGRKVHLAMDTATSDIRAVEFTPSSDGDSPVLLELLERIPEGEQIGTVTADSAYDTRRCHTAIIDRQATAIIPIRKNGRPWKENCPAAIARNETLRTARHFGERNSARAPDRQTAEIQIRVALMNRFSAFGTAEIVCESGPHRGKGKSRLRPQFCTNASQQSQKTPRPEINYHAAPERGR